MWELGHNTSGLNIGTTSSRLLWITLRCICAMDLSIAMNAFSALDVIALLHLTWESRRSDEPMTDGLALAPNKVPSICQFCQPDLESTFASTTAIPV